MGYQFFGGRFYKCVDVNKERLPLSVVENKTECLQKGYRWVNSEINFDNSLNGFMALFQVVSEWKSSGFVYMKGTCTTRWISPGPVVQSSISGKPGLTLKKTQSSFELLGPVFLLLTNSKKYCNTKKLSPLN